MPTRCWRCPARSSIRRKSSDRAAPAAPWLVSGANYGLHGRSHVAREESDKLRIHRPNLDGLMITTASHGIDLRRRWRTVAKPCARLASSNYFRYMRSFVPRLISLERSRPSQARAELSRYQILTRFGEASRGESAAETTPGVRDSANIRLRLRLSNGESAMVLVLRDRRWRDRPDADAFPMSHQSPSERRLRPSVPE